MRKRACLPLALFLGCFLFLFASCMCGQDGAGEDDIDDDFDDDDNAPGAPSDLVAAASGPTSILLEWRDNAVPGDIDGFIVERGLEGTNFVEVAETPPADIPSSFKVYYEDTRLQPETTYYYRVRGLGELGYTDYSNIASAMTLNWDGFSDPVYYDVPSATHVGLGDLDSNDVLDLAVVSEPNNSVSILLNNGHGTFWPRTDYQVGVRPMSVAIGDFDGDIDLDLAVANSGGGGWGNISILFNNGSGTFSFPTNYEVDGTWVWSISTGDFDNDLDLDLAVSVSGLDSIAILMNNGNGTFAAPNYYETGGDIPKGIAVGNLSDDNDLDIAVCNWHQSNNVSVLLNKGNGTFYSPMLYDVLEDPENPAFGDFDNKNGLDIAVACSEDGKVSVLLNEGDGTFTEGGNYLGAGSTLALATGDFDMDGDLDIVVVGGTGSAGPSLVSFLLNLSDGTFVRGLIYEIDASMLNSVAVGDLDGDSDLDVVAGASNDTVIVILFNLLIP